MSEVTQVKGLIYSMYEAPQGHPQQVMKELGITYALSVPQSMFDCWEFFLPENVPNKLPKYLKWFECDPMERIGWGLSKEKAEHLISKLEASPDLCKSANSKGQHRWDVQFNGKLKCYFCKKVMQSPDGTKSEDENKT